VVETSDSLDVLLVGSGGMVYSVFRTIDPLELVVDLPDAVAETGLANLNLDNQLVGKIEIFTFAAETRSMIRLKIALNWETPYSITQAQNHLRVHFEKKSLPSTSEQIQLEPVGKSRAEILRPGMRMGQESGASSSTARDFMSSLRAFNKEALGSASKILDLDAVAMNQELRFYLLADGRLADFKAYQLTDPPMVVVEIMGIQSIETPDTWKLNGPLVSKVQIGLEENKVRIIFGLVPGVLLSHKISTKNNTLQISFTPNSNLKSQ
jgi:hypothetical protein